MFSGEPDFPTCQNPSKNTSEINTRRPDFELIWTAVLENIESPFVWMPLGISVICIVAYPIVKLSIFAYAALAFLIITFAADWVGRFQNRKAQKEPDSNTKSFRDDLVRYVTSVQEKVINLLVSGKIDSARALSNRNLRVIDNALKSAPNDPDMLTVLGYTAKDIYQTSKGKLSSAQRKAYLARAHVSFEEVLKTKPKDPSAHNGLANVLFFEGLFDDAIREHKLAIKYADGDYIYAEQDMKLVESVKSGRLPFDF